MGQKERVLVPTIKERALYAVENVLGLEIRQQVTEKFDNLSVIEIPENSSWEDIYYL